MLILAETGLQATITPTKASNIIHCWASGMYGGMYEENTYWTIRLEKVMAVFSSR